MHHLIPTTAVIPLKWNDNEGIWEVDGPLGGRLVEGTDPRSDIDMDQICPCGDDMLHDEAWGRATDADMPTYDDLSHELGSALLDPTANANVPADRRKASSAMVHMLDEAIKDAVGEQLNPDQRGAVIRQILPIIASVDTNARIRTMNAVREEVCRG